jgi:hypothetical protein
MRDHVALHRNHLTTPAAHGHARASDLNVTASPTSNTNAVADVSKETVDSPDA